MEFDANKPIYMQICDSVCDRILSGELEPGGRIPSVRDFGAEIGVNPNTVMRSYEKLTDAGIIFNRRGIGYFIADNARELVLEQQRSAFIQDEVPQILKPQSSCDAPVPISFHQASGHDNCLAGHAGSLFQRR